MEFSDFKTIPEVQERFGIKYIEISCRRLSGFTKGLSEGEKEVLCFYTCF